VPQKRRHKTIGGFVAMVRPCVRALQRRRPCLATGRASAVDRALLSTILVVATMPTFFCCAARSNTAEHLVDNDIRVSVARRVTVPFLRTAIKDRSTRTALQRALAGALRRLESARCRRLFDEFEDASGRPLASILVGLDQTPASFMSLILFEDGNRARRCADRNVLALTEPGARVVWLCTEQFVRTSQEEPAFVEAILIHEGLHALGLGENPPRSETISRRVEALCGAEASLLRR
jgi:hypothetical protein